jgi:hypothetical protein
VAIRPDTKDWTWVLDRPCPECAFDATRFPREKVAPTIHESASAWRAVSERPRVADRPSPEVWSALEYACHVRDVFRIYDGRLDRMLTEDDPLYPNWDQDATAIEERYGQQDPLHVAGELEVAASRLAERFEQVSGDQWLRVGRRSDGARFTVDSFSRYQIHDVVHHLDDVAKGFEVLGDKG